MGIRGIIPYVCIFQPNRAKWLFTRSCVGTFPAVVDLIELGVDNIAFIVMEEWSSQLIPDDGPCCLGLFFTALRQCIEVGCSSPFSKYRPLQMSQLQHAVFMHSLRMAHLDISLRNLVTDYNGRYAYIDFELARRFENDPNPRLVPQRGTEVPPEWEKGEVTDPYKIDVWALGVIMLRACKVNPRQPLMYDFLILYIS